ncbi:hypothetical protein [Blastochloris tepida]|uniref:Uncharacterized protein n=1 Tax=Blastochloris tepida TaxID=2233851 RepID=A0A348FZD2_9HYPH|nr:hypothetical protein [Blastochloris tepida]BBF92665.1 hypothetical protein BLTE_13500 [Blastochloris tepida]
MRAETYAALTALVSILRSAAGDPHDDVAMLADAAFALAIAYSVVIPALRYIGFVK